MHGFTAPATHDATEFGGTFSLTNTISGAGYVGWFGTQRGYIIDSKNSTTAHADNPTENRQGLISFNDTARFDPLNTPNDDR